MTHEKTIADIDDKHGGDAIYWKVKYGKIGCKVSGGRDPCLHAFTLSMHVR